MIIIKHKQEVLVNDRSLGVIEDFQQGRWLECRLDARQTRTGVVTIRVLNRKPDGNAVLSLVEWLEA